MQPKKTKVIFICIVKCENKIFNSLKNNPVGNHVINTYIKA